MPYSSPLVITAHRSSPHVTIAHRSSPHVAASHSAQGTARIAQNPFPSKKVDCAPFQNSASFSHVVSSRDGLLPFTLSGQPVVIRVRSLSWPFYKWQGQCYSPQYPVPWKHSTRYQSLPASQKHQPHRYLRRSKVKKWRHCHPYRKRKRNRKATRRRKLDSSIGEKGSHCYPNIWSHYTRCPHRLY